MSNLQNNETPGQYTMRMLEEGETREQIEKALMEQGHAYAFVKELVAETAKLRYAQRRVKGLAMILGGALICLISFLLTVTDAVSGNTYFTVLFGLTSLGVIVVFVGLMYVF
jgi:hypothetical protein